MALNNNDSHHFNEPSAAYFCCSLSYFSSDVNGKINCLPELQHSTQLCIFSRVIYNNKNIMVLMDYRTKINEPMNWY